MSRLVIGLDAGGTKLLAGVVGEDGEVASRTVRTWPPEPQLEDVQLRVLTAIQEEERAVGAIDAVGAGLPATMDIAAGVASGSRHLPLAGFAFRAWLARQR